jgi:hypothetical protein
MTRVVPYACYSSDNQRDASIEDQLRPGMIQPGCYVAAGFFFGFDFATFGGAGWSGPRSIELRRPAVKV